MIGVDFKTAQGMFFDRPAVMNKVAAAERRVLSKFGAFVRQRARTSIRTRKKVSEPGTPPSSHTGGLKKFIYFGYDSSAHSVVIGPTRTRKGSTPALLEFGGPETVFDKKGKRKKNNVRARPFMGPAFEKEKEISLPKLWQNAVRK